MTGDPMTIVLKLRYVHQDVDRHGNVRCYFQRVKGGPKVRMRESLGSEEFSRHYHELLRKCAADEPLKVSKSRAPAPGTLRWLCVEYFSAPGSPFRRLDERTQYVRRGILDHILQEPIAPNSNRIFADFPLDHLTPEAIEVLRERKAKEGLPEAANGRVKAMRRVFAFGLAKKLVRTNPALGVAYVPNPTQGFHTWTIEEVEQYEARHPIGTKARLALALLLYTGVRRSDVVRLGKQHVRKDELRFVPYKGRNKRPMPLVLPVLPVLQAIIDASPTGDLTFLVTQFGRPFTANGFGGWFRDRCDEAGLQHCSAHGLRKAGASRAAENGATANQLKAMFGWSTLKQAELYTRAAEQKRMASDGMQLLVRGKKRTKVSHSKAGVKKWG